MTMNDSFLERGVCERVFLDFSALKNARMNRHLQVIKTSLLDGAPVAVIVSVKESGAGFAKKTEVVPLALIIKGDTRDGDELSVEDISTLMSCLQSFEYEAYFAPYLFKQLEGARVQLRLKTGQENERALLSLFFSESGLHSHLIKPSGFV